MTDSQSLGFSVASSRTRLEVIAGAVRQWRSVLFVSADEDGPATVPVPEICSICGVMTVVTLTMLYCS